MYRNVIQNTIIVLMRWQMKQRKSSLRYSNLLNIVKRGKSGAEEIQAMMERFRHNYPETINGANVMLIHD